MGRGGQCSPPDFVGRWQRKALTEGFFIAPKNPSTMLCMVPLPGKCRGGRFNQMQMFFHTTHNASVLLLFSFP